jgi:predicted GNAT superfamily acetyltransferase
MAEKQRFSARVRAETLEEIDEYAEETGLNRSATIDRLVTEWREHTDTDTDATRRVAYLSEQIRVLFWGFFLAVVVAIALALSAFVAPSMVGAAIALLQVGALAVLAIVALYLRVARIRKQAGDGGYMTQLRRGIRRRVDYFREQIRALAWDAGTGEA